MAKKITPQRREYLKNWVYKVWPTHWKSMAPVSNSRAKFLKYVLRDHEILDDDTLDQIAKAVVIQKQRWEKQARQQHYNKMIGIPCLSTWYNDGRWEDIEQDDDEQIPLDTPIIAKKICAVPGCTEETHGKTFAYCSFHLDPRFRPAEDQQAVVS